ncbi:hypothetical protein K2X14_02465 [Acetobacter sp. TBRC 12305]|uniref:Uncharacterized protein n=1 Tax=Acetobacter garciniae TaxID=2817435 RepID=A0A939HM07_9PROT|nr:hypothetical protein [Acetobacter garciniae]MBO1324018.1 hypothetical protein [Acetobacter garciniae]MBX0343707.1 hypothetical protein [Acetobacter garciniae]
MPDTDKLIRIAIMVGAAMVGIIMLCTMYQSFSALMLGQVPPQLQSTSPAPATDQNVNQPPATAPDRHAPN